MEEKIMISVQELEILKNRAELAIELENILRRAKQGDKVIITEELKNRILII